MPYHMVNFYTGERFDGDLRAIWYTARHILRRAERYADTATLNIYNPCGRLIAVFYRGFISRNLIYARG